MLIFRYYLWFAPYLLCGAALLCAVRNRVHRRLPAFMNLLGYFFFFDLPATVIVGLVFPVSVYRWLTVVDSTATFLLEVLVLYELSTELLLSQLVKREMRPIPRWIAAILLLIATCLAAFLPQSAQYEARNIFHILDFGFNLAVIGFLVSMALLTRIIGISWRGTPAGIALGFGVVAAAEMMASPIMAYMGQSSYIDADILRMIAFHVCAVIWLIYVLLPEVPRHLGEPSVRLADIELRMQELQRIVRK